MDKKYLSVQTAILDFGVNRECLLQARMKLFPLKKGDYFSEIITKLHNENWVVGSSKEIYKWFELNPEARVEDIIVIAVEEESAKERFRQVNKKIPAIGGLGSKFKEDTIYLYAEITQDNLFFAMGISIN